MQFHLSCFFTFRKFVVKSNSSDFCNASRNLFSAIMNYVNNMINHETSLYISQI